MDEQTMNEKDLQTMKEKFKEKLEKLMENKTNILIPTAEKYANMVKTIEELAGRDPEKKDKIPQKERNLMRRYSIRIENSETNLYHHGDKAKEEPQKVVKQGDLFNLLRSRHIALGHGGINTMWRDMRNYYGISQ